MVGDEASSRISIVMVSYYTGPVLMQALDAALAQTGLDELILVNNGNPPDMVARLRQREVETPRMRIISGQGNVGFAQGCNLGVAQAVGDIIVLLNPDCLLAEGCLQHLPPLFAQHPDVMLIGANLRNEDGSAQRGSRRNLFTPMRGLNEFPVLKYFAKEPFNLHHTALPDVPTPVPAISGAFMAMRRRDYEALNGMDERYFLHFEDLDFCRRVHEAGGSVYFHPDIIAVHIQGTSDASSWFIERCKVKSIGHYLRKHHPRSAGFWYGVYAVGYSTRWLTHAARCGTKRTPANRPEDL